MATDHNFRIKNGLQVGGTIRIDSAGKFYPANIQNTGGPISFLNGSAAQGISVRDIYAGTTYANRTAAAGTIDALNGFKVAGTTVIDSARELVNITFGNGTSGARFEKDGWIYDTGNQSRFYFETNGRTFYRSNNGHQFRTGTDATDFNISNDGHIHIASNGDSQASSTEYIKAGGNVILSNARHLTVASGAVSGKFAVMSTSVHGSYDFYNNGTSYFNGGVTVDDVLSVTGTNAQVSVNGHIYLNGAGYELRSKDTGGNVRTITRVNSSNELEYGWSANAPVKFMGGGSYTERMRIHTNGNVGIGTALSPNVKLAVDGQLSTGDRRLSLGILDLNSGSTPTQFKIATNIPFASGSADFTVNIKGFRYGTNDMVDLSIGWHYYNSTFYNASVKSSGGYAPTVTLGVENSKVVIHLASPGYWPKLYVESMYSSAYRDSYATGWSWSDAAISSDSGTPTVSPAYSINFGNNFHMKDNGNVGIGTNNPTDKLVVQSTGSIGGGANNANSYFTVTDGTYGLYHDPNEIFSDINGSFHIGANHANGLLRFQTGGTSTRMIILANGSVGIGTDSPATKLDVEGGALGGTTGNTATAAIIRAGRQNLIFQDTRTATGTDWSNATFKMIAQIDSTNHQSIDFVNDASYHEHIDIRTGNQVFNTRFTHDGKVGIGTASPGKKLEVGPVGNTDGIRITGNSANASLIINNTGSNGVAWDISSTGAGHGYGEGALHFGVGFGHPKMKITSDGKVGIGLNHPSEKLVVNVNSAGIKAGLILNNQYGYGSGVGVAATALQFARDNSPDNGQTIISGQIYSGNENESTSNPCMMAFSTKSGTSPYTLTERMRISSTGNVGIGTSNPSQKLDVNGGAVFNGETHIRSTSNVGLRIQTTDQGTTNSDGLRVGLNGTHAFVWNLENKDLALATNNTERLTVQAAGHINIVSGGLKIGNTEVISSGRAFTGTTATAAGGTNTTALASTAFVQQEITSLIGGAPTALNTLNELAAAINDDSNYNTTLTTALATKLPKAGGTMTGSITSRDLVLQSGYHLMRSNHHSGHLEGSYNNVGGNSTKSNPIYTIGSSYNPTDAALSNMYGIGYSHPNFWGTSNGMNVGWGQYAAEAGVVHFIAGVSGTWSKNEFNRNGNKVWDAGNDGAGSGLDADLLDGLNSTRFMKATGTEYNSATNWSSGIFPLTSDNVLTWSTVHNSTSSWGDSPQATFSNAYTYGGVENVKLGSMQIQTYYPHSGSNGNGVYYRTGWESSGSSPYFHPWAKFYDTNNDGSGSGLDADLLDGVQGANYARLDQSNVFGAGTHSNYFRRNNTTNYTDAPLLVESYGGSSTTAGVGFHISGSVGRYLFMNSSANLFWNSTSSKIWHASNDGSGSGLDADLLDGLHGTSFFRNTQNIGSTAVDNLTTRGVYGNSNQSSGQPYDNNAGTIIHLDGYDTAYKSQIFQYSENGAMWLRGKHGSSANWSSWYQVYDENHKPTLAELGYTGATNANNYVLPTALTATTFATSGNVIIGGNFTNNAYASVSSTRLGFGGGNDLNNYHIGTNMEDFGGNYTKLDLRWHTGIRMGAQGVYGGIRFYNNEDLSSKLMSIGEGSGVTDVKVYNNLVVDGSGFFNGTKLEGDSKEMIRFSDSWLRLNPANEFTSGIYGGDGILRTDGHFQVGSSGAKFSVNGSTGNVTVAGTVDGVDIAARDGVLTSTTATANAALPKAGGTMTGALKVGTKLYEDFESAGHFYLGNNDWGSFIGGSGNGYSSTHKGMSFNNESGIIPCVIPIDPEATYRVKIRFKQVSISTGTGKFYFGVDTLNEDKSRLSSDVATSYNYGVVIGQSHSAGTTYTYEDTFSGYNATNAGDHQKFDPEGKYFNLVWIANYTGTGEVVIQSIEVERLPASLWVGDTKVIDESRNLTSGINLNADKINSGRLADARMPTTIGSSASTTYIGTLTGNANTASNTPVYATGSNATHYVTFASTNGGGNSSGAGSQARLSDGGLTYNPSTNSLGVTGNTTTGNLVATNVHTNNYDDSGGTFLFKKGSGSGLTRHLNLADTTADPASVTTSNNPTGISWGQRSDNNGYYMLGLKGQYNNGNSNHSRLAVGWHTGVEIGGNPNYGGTRFFSDSPFVTTTEIMSVGKGDSHVRIANNLYMSGDIYGKSVNGAYSTIYKIGGVFFTWDSDSYGTNTHHCIRSTDGDTFGDHITLNSFGNVRINFDSNGNGTNYFRIGHHTTGTDGVLLTIDESGNATFAGNVTAYSDERLKENIVNIDNALDKVCSMRGIYYNMIADTTKSRRIGLVAQEVEKVLPEVVIEANPEDDKENVLSVDYGNIVALLIEGMKEQQKQIDELKEKLNVKASKNST